MEEENTATFKCLSDEGNPTPLIKWTRGQSTDEVKHGRFNAKVTESTMRVTVDKTINQEEISCYIEEDQAKRQQRREQKVILSVKCESFYYFIRKHHYPLFVFQVETAVLVKLVCQYCHWFE